MFSSKVNRTYSQCLISNQACSTSGALLQQIYNSTDHSLLQQTIDDIQSVMAQDYPPNSKILALRLIKDLFLLSKQSIISAIQNKLVPEVVAVALFKDNHNGGTFFASTNFYKNADERQREGFKNQGVEYVSYCKDSISTWANLVPFSNDGHPSSFSEQYSDLLKRGVVFPKDHSLYSDKDRESFSKVYKVEFFNQDSSMSDSFLTESNCVNSIERELNQCDQLEDALANTLRPNQSETDRGIFKTIMERINIFFHESSVKMLQEIKSYNIPQEYTARVLKYQSKFGQILEDYEYFKSSKIRYDRFYDLYGNKSITPQKQSRVDFSPSTPVVDPNMRKNKLNSTSPMQLSVEGYRQSFQPIALGGKRARKMESSVVEPVMNMKSSGAPSGFQPQRRVEETDPHNQQLQKKRLAEIQLFYRNRMEQEKQQAEVRITQLKRQLGSSNPMSQQDILARISQQTEPLRNKIHQLYQDARESQLQQQRLRELNKQLSNKISQTQRQYNEKDKALKRLVQDTERYKGMATNYQQKIEYLQKEKREYSVRESNNRMSEVSQLSTKKLQKRIENLCQQKQLLKDELNNQRGRKYQNMSNELKVYREEIERLKGKMKDRDSNELDIKMKLDSTEIENIKLKEELKVKVTIVESLKKENQWINKTLNSIKIADTPKKPEETLSANLSVPSSHRLDVKDYLELGMEGLVYYDVMSREFKVKYKRSCFKKKELLYKQNNIEIGVITEVTSSNTLSVTLFLTNYGTKNINNIRLKVLNPTSNQIEMDTNHLQSLRQGEQQKVYLEATLHQYPIGPVVLKLEYPDNQINLTSQFLIPISIIKLVRAITRHNPYLQQSKNLQMRYDHKMIQGIPVLKDYFPNVEFKMEETIVLRMTMIHDHTRTEWNMDLEVEKDYLTIRWAQVTSGYEEIQEYYCKTLRNLFTK